MSGTVCKEQCSKCNCIVKERIIDDSSNRDNCKVVYRDLGECLQKCIVKVNKETRKNGKGCDW